MTNTTLSGNETGDPCALSDCVTVRVEIAVSISLLVGILMVSQLFVAYKNIGRI